jgi:hypothetical protein
MHAFVVFAAVVVTFFIALLAGGAFIGLIGVGAQAVRAVGRIWKVNPDLAPPKPVVRRAGTAPAGKAEAFVDEDAEYAPA